MKVRGLLLLVLAVTAGCGDTYEANKRLNFDVCTKQCTGVGSEMKRFEQGLGYVTCECQPKCVPDAKHQP